jgi:hypothetical protein
MQQAIINSDNYVSTTLPKHGPALGYRFFIHCKLDATHTSIFVSVLTGGYASESIIDKAKSSAHQAGQHDSKERLRSSLRDTTQSRCSNFVRAYHDVTLKIRL